MEIRQVNSVYSLSYLYDYQTEYCILFVLYILFSYFATKLQKTVFYDDSSRIFYCSTSHIHHAGRRLYLLPNG